ncbi:MAG: photosynthetic complex assembly protein PuhC [Luminiphilus sp.]
METTGPSPLANSAINRPVRRVSDRLMILIMVGLLFVVGAVLLARTTDQVVVVPEPSGELLASRVLSFSDAPDGQIVISDGESGASIRILKSGEGSFIRGVVRSLVRVRQQSGVFSRTGFLLTLYADGRLILLDPLTTQAIELAAFGPTNTGEFLALLPSPEGATAMLD